MEWLASIIGVIGVGGFIFCIGLILVVLGLAGILVEPITGGIAIAVGAIVAIGALLYAILAFLNGDQVDLYEKAHADYSELRVRWSDEMWAANGLSADLGAERLYATCSVVASDSAQISIQREHASNVHEMELFGVTCDSLSDLHDSAGIRNADYALIELSRRSGIEGVTAAVNGQRTNIRLKPLSVDPGPAPELTFWEKRTTRKRPLRKMAEDLQNQTLDLDQELDHLATIITLLADEYEDLRRANLVLTSEISQGAPSESSIEKVLLLLDRPPLAEQLQAP